jgi:hypothetical protein
VIFFSFCGYLGGPSGALALTRGLTGCAGLYRRANPDPRGWVAYSIKPNLARPISKPSNRVCYYDCALIELVDKACSMCL